MSCIIVLLFKTSYLGAFHLFSFPISNQMLAGRYRYLLKLLSWRMIAARVLFVTHSSSLVIPSGRAPRQRCLGSIFLFTKGMAQPGIYTNKDSVVTTVEIQARNLNSTHPAFFCKTYIIFLLLKHLLQYSCRKTLYHFYRDTGVMYSSQNMTRDKQVHSEDAVHINHMHQTQGKHTIYCIQRPVSQRTNA